MNLKILVRGGGDIASGAIARMHRAGWLVLVTELAQPLTVRRTVSFSQAVYSESLVVEGIRACLAPDFQAARILLTQGHVVVIVDPQAAIQQEYRPDVIVDGRMLKHSPEESVADTPFVIGLGPGFTAGLNCHAVVETNRGPSLGRVFWEGSAQADTGIPEMVGIYSLERVLRAPEDGLLIALREIGQLVHAGDEIARVNDIPIYATFDGVLRGVLQSGIYIGKGEKIGDVDPRGNPSLCWQISDKALAVGGGVLEAILTWKAKNNLPNYET